MAISVKRTSKDLALNGVKMLCYGPSGFGKTTLAATLPEPIIISAEGGLLSIRDKDVPFIEVSSLEDIEEVYEYLTESEEAKSFESIALDSISEIAEVVLSGEKAQTKDGRQAYGAMADKMNTLVRGFRDISGKHVYMTAKSEKVQDETGKILYYPSMPGAKTAQGLPYFFDEVFALQVQKDEEGKAWRSLLTQSDGIWTAKDRSGSLDEIEEPDLSKVITKILGGKK